MDFKNKHILISGASNGIGKALAEELISKGAKITNFDIDEPDEKLDRMNTFKVDITDPEEIEDALNELKTPIDVLICNAGVMRRGTLLDSTEDDFELLFDVNVKGSWLLLKASVPRLNPGAQVAIMGSRYSQKPRSDPALYGLTKVTQYHMGLLAKETLPDFTFKFILPGPTNTALARHGVSGLALKQKKKIMHSPEHLADLIRELLTSNHSHLIYNEKSRDYRFE